MLLLLLAWTLAMAVAHLMGLFLFFSGGSGTRISRCCLPSPSTASTRAPTPLLRLRRVAEGPHGAREATPSRCPRSRVTAETHCSTVPRRRPLPRENRSSGPRSYCSPQHLLHFAPKLAEICGQKLAPASARQPAPLLVARAGWAAKLA
jgi:hypothetical protein